MLNYVSGIGKNPVKGEGIGSGNGKSLVNQRGPEIVIIERIGTIEIETEPEIRTGTEIGVVTGTVLVIVSVVGTVVVNLSESEIETVTVIAIVIVLGRGKERRSERKIGTMMLENLSMTVAVLVIENIMIMLNQSMSEIDMVIGTGTWSMLGLTMIMGGMINLSMGIGVQKLNMMNVMSSMII